jgi:ABC-2 type transport system permease protein
MSRMFILAKHSMLGLMAFRGFFYSLALQWMIPPLIAMFAWVAVLNSSGQAEKIDWLIANYLVIIFTNQFTYSYEHWTVGDLIRYGRYSRQLLIPYPPILQSLADNFGAKVLFLTFTVPVVALLWVFLRPQYDVTAWQVGFFVLSLLIASLIRFFMGLALACTAFWTNRSDSLMFLNDSLLFLLGGQAAPLAFFPEAVKGIVQWLPFWAMLGQPVNVLFSSQTPYDALWMIGRQLVWLVVFAGTAFFTWRAGVKQFQATGG